MRKDSEYRAIMQLEKQNRRRRAEIKLNRCRNRKISHLQKSARNLKAKLKKVLLLEEPKCERNKRYKQSTSLSSCSDEFRPKSNKK